MPKFDTFTPEEGELLFANVAVPGPIILVQVPVPGFARLAFKFIFNAQSAISGPAFAGVGGCQNVIFNVSEVVQFPFVIVQRTLYIPYELAVTEVLF